MHLIEVSFKGNRKEFYAWDGEQPPPLRASIVVEADRGEDLGVVHAIGEHAQKRCVGCSHGLGSAEPTRKALRVASTRELRQAREVRAQDEAARQKAATLVKTHGLVMKLSDAEWQWDRKKLTFYFTADKRVDFRDLVRDLAGVFRARIELKQIGVRDEAKRLDGVGRCGRQFCSASWLPELRPVNLGVAKDQHLSLNPSQISGACGRLMCCLRYEHELYVESRKRFPKEGKTVVTARGEERVVSNEIFHERVTLRSSEGETRAIPLAQFRRELAAAGQPVTGTDSAASDADQAVTAAEISEIEAELGSEINESFQMEASFDLEAEEPAASDRRRRENGPQRSGSRSDGQGGNGPRGEWKQRARAQPSKDQQTNDGSTTGGTPRPPTGQAPTDASPTVGPAESSSQPDEPAPPAGGGGPRRRRGRRGGRRGRGKGGANGNGSSGPNGQNRADGTPGATGGSSQPPPPPEAS